MTKSEKSAHFSIFSPKTILMFRVGLKKIGYVGNRNHTYISFKPNRKYFTTNLHDLSFLVRLLSNFCVRGLLIVDLNKWIILSNCNTLYIFLFLFFLPDTYLE